jgi:hypothetical protein
VLPSWPDGRKKDHHDVQGLLYVTRAALPHLLRPEDIADAVS